MTRDPAALHIHLRVITPNGPGVIRAHRFAAGLPRWLVLDHWWRESQLTVPEPPPVTSSIPCRSCGSAQHTTKSERHCWGQGGVVANGHPATCGCWCATRGAGSDICAGQAYNRGVTKTAPEDACDVNEGLTRSSGTSREGLGS